MVAKLNIPVSNAPNPVINVKTILVRIIIFNQCSAVQQKSQLITGEIVLEGFSLASLVYVAFQSEVGSWLNFTLSSGTGIYTFEISPSYFQLGSHEAYAIAIGQSVPDALMNFATLTIVEDFTLLAVSAALIVVGVGVLVIMKRRKGGIE